MAFVTYILLAALHSGLQSRFDPEILGITASTALLIMLLDFCVLKGGCYLLGIQNTAPVVDAVAYGGYKFVGYASLSTYPSIMTVYHSSSH